MGWFSKRSSTIVAPDVVSKLHDFGEASLSARTSHRPLNDPRFTWDTFFSKAMPGLQANAAQAISEIRAAAGTDPLAQFGGYELIREFSPTLSDSGYVALLDASLQLMFDHGLSSGHLTRYEADRWIAVHGDLRTSFDRIVEVQPPVGQPANDITLLVGATLMVAIVGPDRLDNQFWIERTAVDTYQAFSMRQPDIDSPALARYAEDEIGSWDTVDGIFRSLGNYFGLHPYWAHEQLAPYFTMRRDIPAGT